MHMMDDTIEIDSKASIPTPLQPLTHEELLALEAAEQKDSKTVNKYLQQRGNINIRDMKGQSMLMLSMYHMDDFNEDFILNLLKKGIDVKGTVNTDQNFYLNTSIIHCAYLQLRREGDSSLFQYLLTRKDIDLNATCDEGYDEDTLHFKTRLSPGDNPNRSYTNGRAIDKATVLHFAAVRGDIDTTTALCETGRVNLHATADLVINKHLLHGDLLNEYEDGEKVVSGLETLADAWVCRTRVGVHRVRGITALQLAAMAGHLPVIKYLIAKGANPNVADNTGTTPLLSAAECGNLDCVIYLAKHIKEIHKLRDKQGANALITAAASDHTAIVKFLHEEKKLPLEDKDSNSYTALDWAANDDAITTFKYLLSRGAKVTKTTYDIASDDIKAFLNYKSGRTAPTVMQRSQRGRISSDLIEKLWLDCQDTTDDDSSDDDDIQQCEATFANEIIAEQKPDEKRIEEHHKKIAQFNTARKEQKLDYSQHQDLRYVIHRGVHFDPTYFNKQKRKELYRSYIHAPHTPEDTCSYATTKLLEQEEKQSGIKFTTSEQLAVSNAAKEVKQYLQKLKATPNKKPRLHDKRKTEYARLMQDYVHLYAEVVNQQRIKTDFGFAYPYNPLISTSFLSERAFVYASGMLFPQGHRLNPHYRRSTGKAKHPILGVIFSYAIAPQYAFENSVNVLDWNHQGLIGIKGHYQHECEVIFETFIPRQYMMRRTLLKLPDFSVEKSNTPPRLGYADAKHQGKFTRDQKAVCELKIPVNSKANIYDEKSKINNIIWHVIEKEDQVLTPLFTTSIYNQGLYPCYPFAHQTLSIKPIKPPGTGGRWGDQKIPTGNESKSTTTVTSKRLVTPDAADEKKKTTAAQTTLNSNTTSAPKPGEDTVKKLSFDSPLKTHNTPSVAAAAKIESATNAKKPAQQTPQRDTKASADRKDIVATAVPAPANAADTKIIALLPRQLLARRTVGKNMVTLSSNQDAKTENYKEVDVPHDGSCCLYGIVLSALLPVIDDPQKFSAIYRKLFGADSQLEAGQIRKLYNQLKCYDENTIFISNSILKTLIDGDEKQATATGGRLRKMLGNHINQNKNAAFVTTNHDAQQLGKLDDYLVRNLYVKAGFAGTLEIAALANMLNVQIAVFQNTPQGLNYASCYGENATNIFYLIYIHTEGNAQTPAQRHYHYLLHPTVIAKLKPQAIPATAASASTSISTSGLMAKFNYLTSRSTTTKPVTALTKVVNNPGGPATPNLQTSLVKK